MSTLTKRQELDYKMSILSNDFMEDLERLRSKSGYQYDEIDFDLILDYLADIKMADEFRSYVG